MSTRSGKRIHSSFHENTIKADLESAVKSERKPRSKRMKENANELCASLFQAKKRNNYVRYPTDDEQNGEEVSNNDKESKHGRVLRRNTLKEQNLTPQHTDNIETLIIPKNLIRKSRRGKKTTEEDAENLDSELIQVIEKPKSKKNIKKTDIVPEDNDLVTVPTKKSKRKKKKGKGSNPIAVEEVNKDDNSRNNMFNKSMSLDSFHSAAGSPRVICDDEEPALLGFDNNMLDTTLVKNSSDKDLLPETLEALDIRAMKATNKRKSNQKDTTFEKNSMSIVNSTNIYGTDGDTESITSDNSNNEVAKRKSNGNNVTFDITTKTNDSTFEKDMGNDKKDSTYDKILNKTVNTTYEKDMSAIKISRKSNINTYDKNEKIENTTFQKESVSTPPRSARKSSARKSSIRDISFDQNKNVDDTTFEKDSIPTPQKSAKKSLSCQSSIRDTTIDKNEKVDDTTFEKDTIPTPQKSAKKSLSRQSSIRDTTIDKNEKVDDTTFEKDTIPTPQKSAKKSLSRQSSIRDTTIDKNEKVDDTTFEKDTIPTPQKSAKKSLFRQSSTTIDKNEKVDDTTFEKDTIPTPQKSAKKSLSRQSSIRDTTFDKNDKVDDTTFEKDTIPTPQKSAKKSLSRQSSIRDTTIDKNEKVDDITFEKDTIPTPQKSAKKSLFRQSSTTIDKNEKADTILIPQNYGEEKLISNKSNLGSAQKGTTQKSIVKDKTFEECSEDDEISYSNKRRKTNRDSYSNAEVVEKYETIGEMQRKSSQSESNLSTNNQGNKLNSTYERNSKSSLMSSDYSEIEKSNISCISITSDESENLINTTPVLIESSMDNSYTSKTQESPTPLTPLKREGTFTKDGPEVTKETPPKKESLPLAGCTPYHADKSTQKRVLNVTRSIERRLTAEPGPRVTRVMFCSPVDNPVMVAQEKRTIIKSNLKGSNKSFVFDESVCGPSVRPAARKRSYTQSDADDARVKRKRLADDMQQSVDRLSRPRTSSATAKLAAPTTPSKKPVTPSKSKSDARPARTKLPNFSALHQRQFSKMESLGECQERKAKRARQLLTPNGALDMLERISPKGTDNEPQIPKAQSKKTDTPTKLPTLESLRPGFTRFGFKLNMDVNPFSVPSKHAEPKPNGVRQALPSIAGATSVRREVAKQAVMREKSFSDRRNAVKRNENRTIIKGVRTNRRFELQMKLRNVD